MRNFRSVRKAAGFQTQAELASHLGIKRATVAKWEIGVNCPRGQSIKKIAEALHVTSDEVIDAIATSKNNV